jgi:hypothetical protein
MGSGVLDAAAASETKIMKDSATPCKVWRPLSCYSLHEPALGGLSDRDALQVLVAGIGFEPMTFGL